MWGHRSGTPRGLASFPSSLVDTLLDQWCDTCGLGFVILMNIDQSPKPSRGLRHPSYLIFPPVALQYNHPQSASCGTAPGTNTFTHHLLEYTSPVLVLVFTLFCIIPWDFRHLPLWNLGRNHRLPRFLWVAASLKHA